ncbi:MAG TPA: DNA repair protein RecO [Candidatus Binataceae bacterium]|nr:DNA repair protein RecO [Candidatus Binataceae bacterium]
MPAEESTPAIVLRARDYAESDRIVTLLTAGAGKLSGIAKGAKASRHRFERKLEPFSHVMLHFRRRPHGQLVFITRAEAGDLAQHTIDDDLAKIALGSYMLELADALTAEEGEAADAYRVLSAALGTLGNNSANQALRQAFEIGLLRWAGFGLEFNRCRQCASIGNGDHSPVYFIVARGGIVCGRCRPLEDSGAIKLSAPSAARLARLAAVAIEDSPGAEPAGVDGAMALSRFMSSILDRRIRSQSFLESVMPAAGGN